MEVQKTQFDAVLRKLIKAPPLPKSAIPRKARRKHQAPPPPVRSESAGQ
jgi:hypothetical protein